MERPSAGGLLGFLVVILVVQASLLLGKGVLLIEKHEGDALHVLEIVFRMSEGQWPHLDFMTPLGVLSFAPIVWLMSLGLGAGKAIMVSFVLFAAILLPALWWACYSRLSGWMAYAFGAVVIVMVTALVYGGSDQTASISMYYNRWAWSVTFVMLILVMLPARTTRPMFDGLIIGLGLSFLALAKIAFFMAFFPGILLALVLRKQGRTVLVGLVVGVLVIGLITIFGGIGFWSAYIGDLRAVANSPIRDAESVSFSSLLTGSNFIAANLCLLASIILLGQAGRAVEGTILLVLAPAFIYVTFQNWGNDPKWLILLAVFLMTLRPERLVKNGFGWDMANCMRIAAIVCVALILPSVTSMAASDLRHAKLAREAFSPVFPNTVNDDIFMNTKRMYLPSKQLAFSFDDPVIAIFTSENHPETKPDILFGQPLPACKLSMGLVGMLQATSHAVDNLAETAGKTVFVADTFSNLWMFGKTLAVKNGAPWLYGDTTHGLKADYVLVPICPVKPSARSVVLQQIATTENLKFREVMRSDLFVLLRRLPD